jgi:hypothetical protein
MCGHCNPSVDVDLPRIIRRTDSYDDPRQRRQGSGKQAVTYDATLQSSYDPGTHVQLPAKAGFVMLLLTRSRAMLVNGDKCRNYRQDTFHR